MKSWRISKWLALGLLILPLAPSAQERQDRYEGKNYRWERIDALSASASLLDLGHHFRIRLTENGMATVVQLPVNGAYLGAIDVKSLHLAFFDPDRKQYSSMDAVEWIPGRPITVRVTQSGDYSLVGLPADPVGKAGIAGLCAIEGRPTRAELDPICTKIYCVGFKEIGKMGLPGEPGVPGGPGFPPPGSGGGGDICDRCLNRGGRLPGEIAECHIGKPFDFGGLPFPPPRPLPVCQVAPSAITDPSGPGTFPVASAEYKFVDAINIPPSDPNTDVWATVRYPGASAGTNAPIAAGTTRFPLVVYLHGNHGTVITSGGAHVCGTSGTPVPNHEGYNYVLDRLASFGFIAISINANDLNCKSDRIVERGKLILEHLRRWKDFDNPVVADPTFGGRFNNRVDLNNVGLAGHSRGGEAIVSAYLENKSAGLGFGIKAVHSIAPVDFHNFILEDVPYYLLLPAADGDVSDLQGARIYDRAAPRTNPGKMPKMQSHLYGANHNWFNTVWFQDEGNPAAGTPTRLTDVQQQAVERVLAVAFFREFLQNFGTARGLFTGTSMVASLTPAQVFRSYQDPVHLNVDDFEDVPANPLANSLGGSNVNASLLPFGEFPFRQSGGAFNSTFFQDTSGLIAGWNAAGDTFTVNLPPGNKDVSAYRYVSFRVTQVQDNGAANPVDQDQDFDVGLEDESGSKVFLRVGLYDRIPFPYQRSFAIKSMLQTVRLGLVCYSCSNLAGIDTHAVTRIHFRFNRKATGLVGFDSIQFSR